MFWCTTYTTVKWWWCFKGNLIQHTFQYSLYTGGGTGQCSQYSDLLRARRSRDRIRVGGGGWDFLTCSDQPWGLPILLYKEYWVFPGGKVSGAWFQPHTPTSTEVKERIYLNFYSPPGPSWSVLGRNLPYTPNMHPNLSQNLQNLIPNFFWNIGENITFPLNFMTNFFAVLLEGTAMKVLNSECQICLTLSILPHCQTASSKKRLEKIQKLACLGITGAMHTTPTGDMEALTGLPPLDLVNQGEARSVAHHLWSLRC
jgi:hypothetical protein